MRDIALEPAAAAVLAGRGPVPATLRRRWSLGGPGRPPGPPGMPHRLARIVDAIAEAVVAVARDGRILHLNPAAARLLGVQAGTLSGIDAGRVLSGRDKPLALAEASRAEGPVDATATCADGRRLPVELTASPLPGGRFLVILRDGRARREAEDLLRGARELAELARRSKTEFVANMSHELRTPLNAILGFAEIIRDGLVGPLGSPLYAEYANDIHESGTHLLQVINDILDLAKVESGHMTLADGPVLPAQVAAGCLRLLRHRAAQAKVELVDDTQGTPPVHLLADERKLKQMLFNVLGNAIKFTPEGGRVTLRMDITPEAGLAIRVSDTGIGIAAEDFERVLSPFGQAAGSLGRAYEGTGLGLPLTRALLELHGGRLDMHSEIGRGTTVSLTFPPERIRPAILRARHAG